MNENEYNEIPVVKCVPFKWNLKFYFATVAQSAEQKHANVDVPNFSEAISREGRTRLLNFLVAPDGQRLFEINCSPCHGKSVAFQGDEEALRQVISQGGKHLDMPAWKGTISDNELDVLSRYVVDPAGNPDGKQPYERYCVACHGERIPVAENIQARETIASG